MRKVISKFILRYFVSAEAAELISSALSFEAEERLEESVAAYRCSPIWVKFATKPFSREAIGKLLSEVQGDPDVTRQAQVVFKFMVSATY